MTIKQMLIAALESEGWYIDRALQHYVVMAPPSDYRLGIECRYFLGKGGALRFSSGGQVRNCVPHDTTKARLLHKYKVDRGL